MKHLYTSLFVAGIMLAGMSAFADDMQKDHMGDDKMMKEMMKECMSRMAAKKDGSTHDQMHAACMEEMKNGKK